MPPGLCVYHPGALICSQGHLLNPPVADFSDEKFIRIPAIKLVDRTELLHFFAGLAELADDLTSQIQFVDLTIDIDVFRRIGIGAVKELPGPGVRQIAAGLPMFVNCVLKLPSVSKT